jgi:hypothetical protein
MKVQESCLGLDLLPNLKTKFVDQSVVYYEQGPDQASPALFRFAKMTRISGAHYFCSTVGKTVILTRL